MKSKTLVLVLTLLLLLTLSCNYPGLSTRDEGLPAEQLRQTLAALSTQSFQGGTPEPGTAVPSTPILPTSIKVETSAPGVLVCEVMVGEGFIQYCAQSGDTLDALVGRFNVDKTQIISPQPLPDRGYIPPGQIINIANTLQDTTPAGLLMPDSEVVYSPTSLDFDTWSYVSQAGGYLSEYSEYVKSEWRSGADIIQLIATESSVNPRFLLAFLEYRSKWVLSRPDTINTENPLGFHVSGQKGLYLEMIMAVTHLHLGYYGWRAGSFTEIKYTDGSKDRMSPLMNAGSAGIQNLFAKFYKPDPWIEALYGDNNFSTLYQQMFGDPWARADLIGPTFTAQLLQPTLELPFKPGQRWSLTGGPHEVWKTGSPRGAIDLAPVTGEPECEVSRVWTLAAAPGVVVRSSFNAVALDLDGDGYEQTGWVILYFHVADKERVGSGAWVEQDAKLGHPSCEGGRVTGTHLHIGRKFNGEWLAADGPLPMVLGGWRAVADDRNYYGELRNGEQVAVASPVGPSTSIVIRE